MTTERKPSASKQSTKKPPEGDRKTVQQDSDDGIGTKDMPYRGPDQLKPNKNTHPDI